MAYLAINKENYLHNLDIISQKLGNIDKIAVVLKDNAYGHGIINIAKLANAYGISKAIVRTISEAEKIKEYFNYIVVLGELPNKDYSHSFHITINSMEDIDKIAPYSLVHLKVDTGMHRNGISIDMLEEAIYRIVEQNLKLSGVFTHHRSADELSSEFFWQNQVFSHVKKRCVNICEKLNLTIPLFHSLNSNALFRAKNIDDDFVRVGIASYGYLDYSFNIEKPNLKPVASLYANKISTRRVLKGEKIGYGGSYIATKEMDVSTYDIGYGDGFLRLTIDKGEYFTPKGYQILGKISMDSLSLNTIDNEVVIFDDVRALSKLHNTISYEILTTLMPNIKRITI